MNFFFLVFHNYIVSIIKLHFYYEKKLHIFGNLLDFCQHFIGFVNFFINKLQNTSKMNNNKMFQIENFQNQINSKLN